MQEKIQLRDIAGEKIRWQYFNVPIYELLYVAYIVAVMCIVFVIDAWSLEVTAAEVFAMLSMFGILLLPFVILSAINRFWIGKIICVLNEEGIYYKDGLIKWEAVTHIEYNAEQPTRYNRHSSAYIIGKNMKVELAHAPYMLLRKAKKYNPEIITGFSKGNKIEFVVYVLLPFVVYIAMRLFDLYE